MNCAGVLKLAGAPKESLNVPGDDSYGVIKKVPPESKPVIRTSAPEPSLVRK